MPLQGLSNRQVSASDWLAVENLIEANRSDLDFTRYLKMRFGSVQRFVSQRDPVTPWGFMAFQHDEPIGFAAGRQDEGMGVVDALLVRPEGCWFRTFERLIGPVSDRGSPAG